MNEKAFLSRLCRLSFPTNFPVSCGALTCQQGGSCFECYGVKWGGVTFMSKRLDVVNDPVEPGTWGSGTLRRGGGPQWMDPSL